jgi:hypothetical protein
VRPVLLWPVAAVTGYLFVACIDDKPKPRLLRGWWGWIWAGLALGASLYIYQPGRVVPFFFLFFVVYIAVADRPRLVRHWRGIVLFFLVGGLLFAPLGIYLLGHTEDRVGQVNQPWVALRNGDPKPMWENGLRALGMFTFIGDPHWRQFVADTPVFEPLGAILFYAGVLLVLWHWRRLEYVFVVLWVLVMLTPAIITEGAPNFLRPIAVLGTVYALPALAIDALQHWLSARDRRWTWVIVVAMVALLGGNAWRTYDGYFNRWAQHPDVRFAYNATIVDAGLYLNEATNLDAVVLSGHFPADLDPALVESALRRTDLQPRWCDVRQSLVYPAGMGNAVVIEPDYFSIDPLLFEQYLGSPAPLDERRLANGTSVFSVYPFSQEGLQVHLSRAQEQPVGWSRASVFPKGLPDDLVSLDLPAIFGGRVAFLGYEVVGGPSAAPGDVVTVVTFWRVLASGSAQTITFLHLLDAGGAVASGYDGFGAPPNRWIAGDTIIQLHRFLIPGDMPAGLYPLELGWYERDTGQRWPVDGMAEGSVDRVLLGSLQIGESRD